MFVLNNQWIETQCEITQLSIILFALCVEFLSYSKQQMRNYYNLKSSAHIVVLLKIKTRIISSINVN